MARRVAAFLGLLAVIALALTLLYRVYLHHSRTQPYVDEPAGSIAALDVQPAANVKFASLIR